MGILKEILLSTLGVLLISGAALASPLQQDLEQIVNRYEVTDNFHGTIVVRSQGQEIYASARGLANEAFEIPHQIDSRFMIASVSKQFTAAAILKLVEDGKLALDDLYSNYVPYPGENSYGEEAWNQIRIRELLTHTSGAARNVRPTEMSSLFTYNEQISTIVGDQVDASNMFPHAKRGRARYSNFGYLLLAHLVSEVTGQDFHDFLSEAFFRPLGLQSTGPYHRMKSIKKMSEGYIQSEDTGIIKKRCCADASNFVGSHGLYSDATDLSLWLEDLSSGDSKVLSPASIAELWRGQSFLDEKAQRNYGLGFHVEEAYGQKMVWHDGMEFGYLSFAASLPESQVQVIVLTNRHGDLKSPQAPYSERLAREVLKRVTKSSVIRHATLH